VERRADLLGTRGDHRERALGLARDHGGHAAAQDRGLLGRDLLQGIAGNSTWSIDTGVITLASGRSTTLVASQCTM